jgi:hypothetical protein
VKCPICDEEMEEEYKDEEGYPVYMCPVVHKKLTQTPEELEEIREMVA